MTKVEIVASQTEGELEKMINESIARNLKMNVVDIKFQQSGGRESFVLFSAMIIYGY